MRMISPMNRGKKIKLLMQNGEYMLILGAFFVSKYREI